MKIEREQPQPIITVTLESSDEVRCPFCLYKGTQKAGVVHRLSELKPHPSNPRYLGCPNDPTNWILGPDVRYLGS